MTIRTNHIITITGSVLSDAEFNPVKRTITVDTVEGDDISMSEEISLRVEMENLIGVDITSDALFTVLLEEIGEDNLKELLADWGNRVDAVRVAGLLDDLSEIVREYSGLLS